MGNCPKWEDASANCYWAARDHPGMDIVQFFTISLTKSEDTLRQALAPDRRALWHCPTLGTYHHPAQRGCMMPQSRTIHSNPCHRVCMVATLIQGSNMKRGRTRVPRGASGLTCCGSTCFAINHFCNRRLRLCVTPCCYVVPVTVKVKSAHEFDLNSSNISSSD